MAKGIIFASIVGVVGAALWAALAYFANIELGLLAWAIGAAVGFAMMAGAQGEVGLHTGVAALIVALVTIAGGKLATVELIIQKEIKTLVEDQKAVLQTNDEVAITYVADDVLEEFGAAGRDINYPPMADLESPQGEMDYPVDVWAEASQRWAAMTPAEQDAMRQSTLGSMQEALAPLIAEARPEMFKASFSFFDILWFGLGGFSAFRLGAGGIGEG